MKYLLDTNICIPLINGSDKQLATRLLAMNPGAVGLCSIVKAELYFGAANSSRVAENLDRVQRFCSVFKSLPFEDEAAKCYGRIRALLKREGRPIGNNDLLIAATALIANVTVVTRNLGEFRRVPGVAVEEW